MTIREFLKKAHDTLTQEIVETPFSHTEERLKLLYTRSYIEKLMYEADDLPEEQATIWKNLADLSQETEKKLKKEIERLEHLAYKYTQLRKALIDFLYVEEETLS